MTSHTSWYFSSYSEGHGDLWQKFEGQILFGCLGGGENYSGPRATAAARALEVTGRMFMPWMHPMVELPGLP